MTTTHSMQSRDLLSLRWQRQVGLVTDLAVRRYSIDDTDPLLTAVVDVLDAQLDAARRSLVDIEVALQRTEADR